MSRETVWAIEDHLCAGCCGRLVSRFDKAAATRLFRCTNCGAVTLGSAGGHPAGCCCGLKVGRRDAGLRCIPNPQRSNDSPSEIVAKEIG